MLWYPDNTLGYEYIMKSCRICNKTAQHVVKLRLLRGKYNPTMKHAQSPNLQWLTLPSGRRIKVCARCKKGVTKGIQKVPAGI